jgi:Fe-S-cluster containining protein
MAAADTQPLLAVSGCRIGCAACCIAPSISSPLPGMPNGKPAGVACPQLDAQLRCKLFGLPQRPAVCVRLRPMPSMCGASREEALNYLEAMEQATAPRPGGM